jgi:CheY-like chemotaxis protein
LLSIINNILDLSKIDAGKFIIEDVPFNVTELMHSVQVMFATKAKNKGLKLTLLVDSSIDYNVSGDPMRLTQILMNLIGNALKFTDKGRIDVSCVTENEDEESAALCFTIKDSGIGIAADKLESVFERFTQADSNTTRKYGGTGLGLSITKQLIKLLGGSITVKSEEGTGTEFSFVLPFTKSSEERYSVPGKEIYQLRYNTVKKILIVEDTVLNQKLTSIILQNNGFEIALAENGKKAVEILGREKFDLILMDIQMPEMDGYQATCMVREVLKLKTPIIAMTAHALAGEKEKCFQEGINDYLAKPFSENDLLFKISHLIKEDEPSVEQPEENMQVNVIDLSFLKKQTRNNTEAIAQMIRIFLEENPKDIVTLETAIDAQDFTTIYKTAHSLKSETSMFGLRAIVSTDLNNIEEYGRARKNIEEIKKCFSRVKQVCEQAADELKSAL